MSFRITDGKGKNGDAFVTDEQRLAVDSISSPVQHHVSHESGDAYQTLDTATCAASTVVVLHIKNTHATKDMVFTYLRCQVVDQTGGTALPSGANYFRIAFGRTLSSGGDTLTPVNMKRGSGHSATAVVTGNAPTLTGTAVEFDRAYPKAEGEMIAFSKEGAVILEQNQTLEISFVGDHTAGTLYARASFFFQTAITE